MCPSGAGLRNEHFLIMHTSIGYKLSTFGEFLSVGRVSVRPSGAELGQSLSYWPWQDCYSEFCSNKERKEYCWQGF